MAKLEYEGECVATAKIVADIVWPHAGEPPEFARHPVDALELASTIQFGQYPNTGVNAGVLRIRGAYPIGTRFRITVDLLD